MKAEGRAIGTAFNDAQKARQSDVFIQLDERYVVRASRGREHIFDPDGTHITTVRRSQSTHKAKLLRSKRRPITNEGFEKFKELFR